MKYFFYLLVIFIATNVCAGSGGERFSVDYQLFEQGGKKGIRDKEGNILIPAEYEALGWSKGALQVVNNVVGFQSSGQWGLINLENERITTACYSQLYPADKGLLIAGMKGKFSHRDFLGIISTTGAPVIPFKYASIQLADLRAIVSDKRRGQYFYGVVDLGDNIIIPLRYRAISPLGNLRFAVRDFKGKTTIFNDSGKMVMDFVVDSISPYSHGLAIIYKNHQRGLINVHGQVVMPAISKELKITDTSVKQLPFNTWKVIDQNNNSIAQFHYDQIFPYDYGVLKVSANGNEWLIDTADNVLTPICYDELGRDINNCIPFRHESQWGVIKTNGELLLPARFDSVFLSDDIIYVREKTDKGLKWMLYDIYGVKKSNHYDEIRKPTQFLYPVSRNGYWGFIDRTGEEVIHCVYDDVSNFIDGLTAVKFHGEFGVLDKSGEWILLPQESRIQIINDKYYLAKKNNLTILKSFEDGTVYFTENAIEVKEHYLVEHLSGGGVWQINFEGRIFNDIPEKNQYEEVRPPSEGFYAIKLHGKYGFIDAQNRLRIANRYDNVGPFSEGLAAVNLLGRWGFIDKRERLVVQPIYHSSSVFQNGLAIVEDDRGTGLITPTGEEICSFEYDTIVRQTNGRFLIEKNNRYGLISDTGDLLINAKYEELKDLNNGFAIIKKFGKYGLINLHGVDIIPVIYDQLYYDPLNNNYLAMKKSAWEDVRIP